MGRSKRDKKTSMKYYIENSSGDYIPVLRVARVTGGKMRMIWATKSSDGSYEDVNINKAVLR